MGKTYWKRFAGWLAGVVGVLTEHCLPGLGWWVGRKGHSLASQFGSLHSNIFTEMKDGKD